MPSFARQKTVVIVVAVQSGVHHHKHMLSSIRMGIWWRKRLPEEAPPTDKNEGGCVAEGFDGGWVGAVPVCPPVSPCKGASIDSRCASCVIYKHFYA